MDAPILPALLASACRGSHAARKHLLLASLVEQGGTEHQGGTAAQGGTAQQQQHAVGAGGPPRADASFPAEQGPAHGGAEQPGSAGAGGEGHEQGAGLITSSAEQGSAQEELKQSSSAAAEAAKLLHPRVGGGPGYRIYYTTIGPIEGFG